MGLELLAGLGLSLAGTGLGIAASQQDQSVMNAKVSDELTRQQGYQQKANQAFQASAGQSGADTTKATLDQGAAQQKSLYQSLQSPSLGTGTASLDPVTQAATNASIGASNDARSKLSSYGGLDLQNYLRNLGTSQKLGVIGNQAQQSEGVLPYEIQQAGHSGDMLAGVGSGLSALGSLAGLYGIYSSLPSAAGAAPIAGATSAGTPFANTLASSYSGISPTWSSFNPYLY